jgi:hypothetical protein
MDKATTSKRTPQSIAGDIMANCERLFAGEQDDATYHATQRRLWDEAATLPGNWRLDMNRALQALGAA